MVTGTKWNRTVTVSRKYVLIFSSFFKHENTCIFGETIQCVTLYYNVIHQGTDHPNLYIVLLINSEKLRCNECDINQNIMIVHIHMFIRWVTCIFAHSIPNPSSYSVLNLKVTSEFGLIHHISTSWIESYLREKTNTSIATQPSKPLLQK